MNINIGDKVRFLNSVGGGIVRSFKGKELLLVEDEDGFDIPVPIRECVVVDNGEMKTSKSPDKPKKGMPADTAPKPKPIAQQEYKAVETSEGERLNIYLAYLPVESSHVISQSGYEAYFVNESNYYLFFNYMNRENNSWISRHTDLIEPNTKIFMEEFGKEDLNSLERVCVQFIAFKKDKPYALKNATSVELRLDTVKFYKQHCFMENDFFEEDALLYPVVRQDVPEWELSISPEKLKEAMREKTREEHRTIRPALKKKIAAPILEVDLHIGELLDSTAGLSNSDILEYQLGKFREVLASHASNKGQKIVFIHGKGDGVLRKAIEQELKTKYKQYTYQDASFREYGFGATMVIISHK